MKVEDCNGCSGIIPDAPRYKDPEVVETFAQITKLGKALLNKELDRGKRQGRDFLWGLPKEVQLGEFDAGEKRYRVVFGAFDHHTRSIYNPDQPKAFKITGGWVLAVGEISTPILTPIAYEADFAELDEPLKRPLVKHLATVEKNRFGRLN